MKYPYLRNSEEYDPRTARLVKYLGEFLSLKCAPDMMQLGLFPNGKEITESFAAYNAVRWKLREIALDDPSITLVVVGDGSTPRTAATFAMRTAWECHSVDPLLRDKRAWGRIRRLTVHRDKVENVRIHAERAVIVAVHSHAPLDAAVQAVDGRVLAVVAIPCCKAQELGREPDLEYEDPCIISPKRTVRVWREAA